MSASASPHPVLSVRDLAVAFPSESGRVDAVRQVSFDLARGRSLGIVGESGSGKSVTALSIMGLLPTSARVSGSITLNGRELVGLDDRQMCGVRGKDAAMVFQDPLSALSPVYTVGDQIVETVQVHHRVSRRAALARAVDLLRLVGIPEPERRVKAFPHEFSGGMRQRVVIASAIANDPDLLIADEPTTALDVTVQAQVLEVMARAQEETGAALLMITHDLGVVAGTCDDVLVMYAGKPVERAGVDDLFADPRMPYTLGLLGAVPRVDLDAPGRLTPVPGSPPLLIDLPPGCPFAPRCPVAVEACTASEPALAPVAGDDAHTAACWRSGEIADGAIGATPVFAPAQSAVGELHEVPREEREVVLEVTNLTKEYPVMKGTVLRRQVGTVRAVKGVSFDVREGECVAIVGESGSGKTTTLMEIMELATPPDGRIVLNGVDTADMNAATRRRARRDVQLVFQDPMGALDPRYTVADIIAEPMRAIGRSGPEVAARVRELMGLVGLDPAHVDRFPAAFSGGQRQRIGIARALSTNPRLVVLDEPVSALDVSIQAGVLNLLDDLRARLGVSYLFVAHDLAVVRHLADRVAVMHHGEFVETGSTADIFDRPQHPYTRALLSAVPIPDPARERERERVVLETTPDEAPLPS